MPLRRPTPLSSSVPWTVTWCGLELHLAAGTQLARTIRTERTWRLVVLDLLAASPPAGALAGALGAPSDAPGAVPPGPAGPAARACGAAAHASNRTHVSIAAPRD
jgi:hypothetical protein